MPIQKISKAHQKKIKSRLDNALDHKLTPREMTFKEMLGLRARMQNKTSKPSYRYDDPIEPIFGDGFSTL